MDIEKVSTPPVTPAAFRDDAAAVGALAARIAEREPEPPADLAERVARLASDLYAHLKATPQPLHGVGSGVAGGAR